MCYCVDGWANHNSPHISLLQSRTVCSKFNEAFLAFFLPSFALPCLLINTFPNLASIKFGWLSEVCMDMHVYNIMGATWKMVVSMQIWLCEFSINHKTTTKKDGEQRKKAATRSDWFSIFPFPQTKWEMCKYGEILYVWYSMPAAYKVLKKFPFRPFFFFFHFHSTWFNHSLPFLYCPLHLFAIAESDYIAFVLDIYFFTQRKHIIFSVVKTSWFMGSPPFFM